MAKETTIGIQLIDCPEEFRPKLVRHCIDFFHNIGLEPNITKRDDEQFCISVDLSSLTEEQQAELCMKWGQSMTNRADELTREFDGR